MIRETARTHLVVLHGIPDSGMIHAVSDGGQGFHAVFMGTSSFLPHLSPGRFAVHPVYLSNLSQPQTVNLPQGALINYMSDPDLYGMALGKAVEIVSQMKRRCFNDPRHILKTRRDQLETTLGGIPGVRIPRTIRFVPKRPGDFAQTIRQNRLRYPVIVRLAGDQGGISTVRLDRASDLDPIYALPWGGRSAYLSEWHEYRDQEGLYYKDRLVFIGGVPMVRTSMYSSHWMIHSHTQDLTESHQRIPPRITWLETEVFPRLNLALMEIQRRISLDYFGVDCHVNTQGEMLIFEANATMNNLLIKRSTPDSPMGQRIARIRTALEDHLESYATPHNPRQPALITEALP